MQASIFFVFFKKFTMIELPATTDQEQIKLNLLNMKLQFNLVYPLPTPSVFSQLLLFSTLNSLPVTIRLLAAYSGFF